MVPIVAGALSPDELFKLRQWQAQMTSCCNGKVNGTTTHVMRDTGSTTCVVKTQQWSDQNKWLVLISFVCSLMVCVVKLYPTAVVEFETPYYIGTAKMLCMETPVQDIIIGNIPGTPWGVESIFRQHETDRYKQQNWQVLTPHKVKSGSIWT